jgi:ATP-dependent protease ClpP protease subunit
MEGLATAEVTAQGGEAGWDDSAQPRSRETICMIEAGPRMRPKALPQFPNPASRPEGSLPPLVLNFFSEVANGIDIALGRVKSRDTAAFLHAIRSAADRSIICNVNCAGGDAEGALAIAVALLQHEYRVTCRIVGRCSSAAAFIALAADTRTIIPSGYVLLHTARRLCTMEQWEAIKRLPPHTKEAINDSLNDIDDATAVLLQTRIGVSEDVAWRWLKEDRKIAPLEAVERGFVHAIASTDLAPIGATSDETGPA